MACAGVPPDLVRPSGRTRESLRQWTHTAVEPLGRLVAAELRAKLGAPVALSFRRLEAADVVGKARAWRGLVGKEGSMTDADARRIVGLT